jgi:hypothetical protein
VQKYSKKYSARFLLKLYPIDFKVVFMQNNGRLQPKFSIRLNPTVNRRQLQTTARIFWVIAWLLFHDVARQHMPTVVMATAPHSLLHASMRTPK